MKTSSAKAKGRRLQTEVQTKLVEKFATLEPDDVRVAIMGESGEDLKLSPAARRVFPYSIECKNVEKLNIWGALEQAESNSGKHEPLLIFKRNRSKIYVALEFDHFLKLVSDDKKGHFNPTDVPDSDSTTP